MNRAYKLVWNGVSNSWIVVSELAKGRKKSSGTALRLALCVAAVFSAGIASAAPAANALPTGEKVASGRATFDRTVTNQLTVNQSTSKLLTNWKSFDIGSNGKVQFVQPDASSIALNRITNGNATQIFGQLSANGQLVLVNPNGITFGTGSQVSAASIIGSVLDIQDSDFSTGNLDFGVFRVAGVIDNQGSLTARAGSVSLLSPRLTNSGTITAQGGNVHLINARYVNLNSVEPSTVADSSVFTGYVQQSGQISATQVSNVGGRIVLLGNTNDSYSKVALAGTLHANDTRVTANQIQVTGVLAVDGANHQLSLNSSTPYTLDTGSKINLNGIHSGFSVNGNTYTVIRDINQLQAINTDLAGRYVLGRDVNASATSTWNAGAGFVPIGSNNANGFSGLLDGLGHSVNGLVINTPNSNGVGLIGSSSAAQISNIGLKKASIHGSSEVGGLVGNNSNTAISNSYVIGIVSGYRAVGGLVGGNSNATISNSYASGKVSGDSNTGGLVGTNTGSSIKNSYATASVSGVDAVGGLVGDNAGASIISSYASGSVRGKNSVGGLIGSNSNATISNSYASGNISGDSNTGGLVGTNTGSSINNSYATASVSGVDAVGGLVGDNTGASIISSYASSSVRGKNSVGGLIGGNSNATISNSYASGNISGANSVGGLIGGNSNATINSSFALGNISGANSVGGLIGGNWDADIGSSYASGSVRGRQSVGGLVGSHSGAAISNSHATGNVGSVDYFGIEVGGLVGSNSNASIINSYASGNIYALHNSISYVGGLVGSNDGATIIKSYASGRVRGGNSTGGLVGFNLNSSISSSYASGNVSSPNTATGGLVGWNAISSISGSYASGNVSSDNSEAGGLVGRSFNASISNSYASGNVRGDTFVGGLVGWNRDSDIDNSYATGNVYGFSRVGGLVGGNYISNIGTSYASGSVRGDSFIGGLLGWNESSIISNTYASGSVWGNESVGGLVGVNSVSNIITSYASGSVRGRTAVGGLAGLNQESVISKSYWQDQTQGRIGAVGINTNGVLAQVTGLSSSQIKHLGSFANWGSTINAQGGGFSVWRIYEGQTAPMLRAFLKPMNVSIHNADASKTYDGKTYSDLSYTLMDSRADATKVLSNLAFRNAGSYSYGSGLYSTQHGYDLVFVDDGTYTITPRALTISTVANSKIYDGGVTSANKPLVTGLITGDRITGLFQQYETKTVGTGKKLLIKNGYVVQDGNSGGNYSVTEQGSMDGVITAN